MIVVVAVVVGAVVVVVVVVVLVDGCNLVAIAIVSRAQWLWQQRQQRQKYSQ